MKIPSQKVPVPTQENAKDTIEIEEEEDTQEDDQAAIMQKMIETMETDDLDSDSEQVPSIIVKNQPTHAPVLATMPTTATLNVQERNNPAVTTAKTVTITNAITQEQITYTHWTGTYVPEFTVTVQNEHIGMSETKTIEIGQQQQITVSYDAHFPAQRSSQDSTVVTLQDTTKAVAIQFDWQGNPRLKIEQS